MKTTGILTRWRLAALASSSAAVLFFLTSIASGQNYWAQNGGNEIYNTNTAGVNIGTSSVTGWKFSVWNGSSLNFGVTTTGNTGAGTGFSGSIFPANTFEVAVSNTSIISPFQITNRSTSSTAGTGLLFRLGTSGYAAGITAVKTSTDSDLYFRVGSSLTDRLHIIGSNGYVGVNQPSPSAQLDVLGAAKATNSDTTTGAAAITGQATATATRNYGVLGISNASSGGYFNSAGVKGIEASGEPTHISIQPAGVLGVSTSWFGVLGYSKNFVATRGAIVDESGLEQAVGRLGYNNVTLYGVHGEASAPNYAVYAQGNLGASGTKSFVEPHPTDAGAVIRYVSLEGPESGVYFRGVGQIASGHAFLTIPESFRIVADSAGVTVQLTAVGSPATLWVESIDAQQVAIRGSADVTFHYLVQGVRKAFRDFVPSGPGTEFMPESPSARIPGNLPEELRQRLIANGTYNPDGTVNMETARRLGWEKAWQQRGRR